MNRSRKTFTKCFVAAAAAVGIWGAQLASASAAPAIKVSISSQTSTTVTLKVTGSGFTKSSTPTVEFDQNGLDSGNATTAAIKADATGAFTLSQTVPSSPCLIGVVATDASTGRESNGLNVSLPSPCVKPALTARLYDPQSGSVIEVAVSHFYRSGDFLVIFEDTRTGAVIELGYPVGSDGHAAPHYGLPRTWCRHTVQVTAIDDWTDYQPPSVNVLLTCAPTP